ncbi:MAG: LysM peptidoglycan-binding domain-containing protein [Pirellulales bacterium]
MGKEIKIGLAVILALLVVFGVVLVQRLRNPAETTEAAAEGDAGEQAGDAAKTVAIGAAASAKSATPVNTLTEAKDNRWTAVPDGQSARAGTASDAAVASDAASANRLDSDTAATDRYADRSATAGSTQAARAGKTGGAAADEAYDPYASRSSSDRYAEPPASESTQPATSTKLAPVRSLRQTADPSLTTTENPLRSQSGRTTSAGSTAGRTAADAYAADSRSAADQGAAEDSRFASSRNARDTGETPVEPGVDASRSSNGTYVVEPNDNFWTISRKVYGSEGYFNAIKEHNRGQYPRADRLRPGDVVSVPAAAVLRQSYPDLCPKPRKTSIARGYTTTVSMTGRLGGGRTYVVEEGDTLFDIARHELGKVSRWAEIYDLNQEVVGGDFDYLRPGTRLALPGDQPADNVTRNPDLEYQR